MTTKHVDTQRLQVEVIFWNFMITLLSELRHIRRPKHASRILVQELSQVIVWISVGLLTGVALGYFGF